MRIAITVIAWTMLGIGLAAHAAASDWWELALLALIGIVFLGVALLHRSDLHL